MGLVNQDIANLSNGVSQQPAVQRLPSQAERQENCQSSVVDGMKRRPPTRHLAKVSSENLASAFIHIVDRDEATKYAAVISAGDLKVFDLLTGMAKAVAFPDGKDYLVNTDPRAAFRAVTAADYTFVVNRAAIVGMSPTKSPTTNPTAMVSFFAANYREVFTLNVDGRIFTLTLPAATANEATREHLNTSNVASYFYSLLTTGTYAGGANAPTGSSTAGSLTAAGYTVDLVGSNIKIARTTDTDFTIQATDGASGNHMRCFKGSTQKFTELPKVGIDGFTIKITGDPGDEGTDYWVQYKTASAPPVVVDPGTGGNTGEPPPVYGGGGGWDGWYGGGIIP